MNKIIFQESGPLIFEGNEYQDIEIGSIVKVVRGGHNNINIGEILIKTSNNEKPFVNLSTGALWGNLLYLYKFEVLSFNAIELKKVKDED